MPWIITAITFLAVLGVTVALIYAFSPAETSVAGRVQSFRATPSAVRTSSFSEKQTARAGRLLASLGKYLPADNKDVTSDLLMLRAGFRSPSATLAMRGAKLLLPLGFVALLLASGTYRSNPVLSVMIAAVGGYMLPGLWLKFKIRRRQHRLRKALADALDLLVICIEAGLGLDQALVRVSQELRITHPDLSAELQLVNMEMRVGKTRLDALRELGRRTGVDDIKALVAMLVQADRFGTSIAQSLRVHADDLRMKRRQRAEEAGAKTSVKMVPALVFFIFPALMVVLLGPAVLSLIQQLGPALK